MMTFVALLILGVVQLGLMWLAHLASRALALVPEGPWRRVRAFYHWLGASLINSLLLYVIPGTLSGLMDQWLEPINNQLATASAGFGVLAWTYPIWLQIKARRDAV